MRGQRIKKVWDTANDQWETYSEPATGGQFCNLTTVVVRADDDIGTLAEKIRLATILGTIQATKTHFPYLRDCWRSNTEEEALLGVSMTGIMDNKLLSGRSKQS